MSGTIVEKLLAKAAGEAAAQPGDILSAQVDRMLVNDFVGPNVCYEFAKAQIQSVRFPERVMFCFDHHMPPANITEADNMRMIRQFCRTHNILRLGEIGRHGIGHQVMVEDFVQPGEIAVGTDTHATMYGALGAFSCGITASDAVVVLATGNLWFRVPQSVRITLTGRPNEFVTGKDIALALLAQIGDTQFSDMALEIGGPGLSSLPMDARFCIANMLAETDAKAVILETDTVTNAYIGREISYILPDSNASYCDALTLDLSKIEPLAACPDCVANVHSVDTVASVKVDQVFIGSCTNGRIEDLRQATEVLRGKKVAPDTRLIVVPASQQVMRQATKEGIISDLLDAGAAILTPTCAACAGTGVGVIGENEVCVSTTNRNFKGRMGSRSSQVYLVSAYTAAATALTGRLCRYDPDCTHVSK